ncbi:superoxide dismutase family protein [Pseudoxanthomonas sp. SGNA-20]|jgi:Cu/Zn superoxide dismutase|uniref:superoxide dismutase family protein n=1 Tax=unclassified Pseudoxanthomonas TaxID=2645906 RepID=UPI000F62B555|nr:MULTISPECIES: superoxide dismutase family protein [unclassified Pseudoxanthomonas]RRN59292.1 superoxide dismutase family protein [Pseudoxanthomonas sp. SGNA-20]RRN78966.1 superoxide dismutase family protein [Pseudoxanthomonas sp. SGD-10]
MKTPAHPRIALPALAALALLAGCSTTEPVAPAPPAPAEPVATSTAQEARVALASASGSRVSGTLVLVPMDGGVHVRGQVGGLPANGQFGFHVHEKGDCSAADATSAGSHFNPAGAPHGRAGSGAHHGGDMDNISSDAEGVATVDAHLLGVTLGGGAANDIAGRAVIVHADPDDYQSQPTGNAGARVACGVIKVVR